MTILHKLSAAAVLLAAIAIVPACAPKSGAPAGGVLASSQSAPAPTVTQASVAAATAAAPSAVALATAINPKAASAIATACPIALNMISIVGDCLSGGAKGPNSALADINNIVAPSCTAAGKLQLVVNDTAAASTGPSPTNSGDSAAFILSMSQKAEALAPYACPIAKAFLGS